jgi:hypothetical protein
MKLLATSRFLQSAGLMVAAALTTATVLNSTVAFTQELPKSPNQAKPIDPSDPNVLRPVDQENNILSMPGGQRLMQEAKQAASSQNYTLAIKKYQEARQVYNQLSNFYQDLAGSFSGIDNRIADTQRKKALETAQLRDEATYQLALVHRAQNQPELAVPLLVQIVRSQQPTRDLGQRAYQQLLELGFVEAPFPRSRAEQPNSTPSRQ